MELQGNTSIEVMTLRIPSSPNTIAGLGLHLERINLRGNHDAFKKDMTPKSGIFFSFHPVPQEQIQAPPRPSDQHHGARRHHYRHS
jgi:hypothetical protein